MLYDVLTDNDAEYESDEVDVYEDHIDYSDNILIGTSSSHINITEGLNNVLFINIICFFIENMLVMYSL